MYRLMRRHSDDQNESCMEEAFAKDEVVTTLNSELSYFQKNLQPCTIEALPPIDGHMSRYVIKGLGFWIRYWIVRVPDANLR